MSVTNGGDGPVAGDPRREHWVVPVHGLTHADPGGIVQAIPEYDGTVSLHLTSGDLRAMVRLDVYRATQLCTGIREAARIAQQLTGHLGDDRSAPPQPAKGSGDLPEAWRAHPHRNAPPRHGSPTPRGRLTTVNNGAAMDATRTIGLRLQRIRHARDKSLRVIAGLAGMSTSTLHRIEHGQRELTISEIVALANALKINPVELIRLPILAPATDHKTG